MDSACQNRVEYLSVPSAPRTSLALLLERWALSEAVHPPEHKDLPVDLFGLLMMIPLSSSATEGRAMTFSSAEEDFAGQALVLGGDCFEKLVDR